jgi:hypothetical protein
VFVFHNNEKSGSVTKEFNTPSQCRLRVDCQFVGIIHNDAFEKIVVVELYVRFCKLFEFVADEFDSFSVGTVDKHYVIFDSRAVKVVYFVNKIADDGSLSRSRRTVENDVGDFADSYKVFESR